MGILDAALVANYESFIDFKKITDNVHNRQLKELKKHPDTQKISIKNEEYKCGDVINHVASETKCNEIKSVAVYSTTNRAIHSLNAFVKKEVKKELDKKKNFNKKLCMALESQVGSFVRARGFFSTISKEVYIVRDIHLIGEKIDKKIKTIKMALSKKKITTETKETKTSSGGWKKTYGYKPPKFSHKDWIAINFRSTLAHELFHYFMDIKCHTNSMMMQEEYAYKNMIGWARKEGLKDDEIILSHLMWYGGAVAVQKDDSLAIEGRNKELRKAAKIEAQNLIDRYNLECRIVENAKNISMPQGQGRVDNHSLRMIEI
jgi:hypothetical protein